MISKRDTEFVLGFGKDYFNWIETIKFTELSDTLPVSKSKDPSDCVIYRNIILVFLTSRKIFHRGSVKSNFSFSLLDLTTVFPPEMRDGVWADEDVYFSMKREIEKG